MTLLDSHPLVLNKQLAVILGLNEALILQQVHYWIEINKKNNRNFQEGRYWPIIPWMNGKRSFLSGANPL